MTSELEAALARLASAVAAVLELGLAGDPPAAVSFMWGTVAPLKHGEEMSVMANSIKLKDSDPAPTASVQLVDAKGAVVGAGQYPATAPNWNSSDQTVCQVNPTGTGWTAEVLVGLPGSAKIAASFTLDDGTKVNASGDVTVSAGDAVSASIEFTPGAQGATPEGFEVPGSTPT